jgi:hypothetical protein
MDLEGLDPETPDRTIGLLEQRGEKKNADGQVKAQQLRNAGAETGT